MVGALCAMGMRDASAGCFHKQNNGELMLLFNSLNLCFTAFSIAEIHRLILMHGIRTVTSRLYIMLSIQGYRHSHYKRRGVSSEYFRSDHAISEALHENGHANCLGEKIELHSSNECSQLLDIAR